MVSRSRMLGGSTACKVSARVSAQAAVVAACIVLAGCATRQSHDYQAGYGAGYERANGHAAPYWRQRETGAPQVAGYVDARTEREVEDDGLPVQAAPRLRAKPMPDDPTQPFSPNYGRVLPSRSAGPSGPMPGFAGHDRSREAGNQAAADLPRAFGRQLADAAHLAHHHPFIIAGRINKNSRQGHCPAAVFPFI